MFAGFLNRGRSKAENSTGDAVPQVFSSNAAAALAASVAAASEADTAVDAPQQRGRVLHGQDVDIDLDALRPGEAVPELQVQPITLLKVDYKQEHTQQVAISSNYICYGLKAGQIRTLNRNTATRALFKGHSASISFMTFFNPDTSLLASCSRNGDIAVRMVRDAPGADGESVPADTFMMTGQLPVKPVTDSAAPPVTLAWHPSIPQILAAGAGSAVNIFEVPVAAPEQQPPAPSLPGIQYSLPSTGTVTAVGFSPRGDLLVAADSTGHVHAWWMEGEDESDAPLLSWQPFSSSGCIASILFLAQADDGSSLLLTGDATNAVLKLWAVPAAGSLPQAQPRCLQTLTFKSQKGPSDIFCHAVVQPELQLVVLANTVRKQVYTLHYALSSTANLAGAQFDYAAFFAVKQPILSLTTGLEAVESQVVPGEVQPQQLLLYTVQTDAIQQYVVNPATCSTPGDAGATDVPAADTEGIAGNSNSTGSTAAAAPGADAHTVFHAAAAAGNSAENAAAEGEESSAAAGNSVAVTDEAPASTVVPPPTELPTPGLLLHGGSQASKAAAHTALPRDATATSELQQDTAQGDSTESVVGAVAEESQAESSSGENDVPSTAGDEEINVNGAAPTSTAPSGLPPMPTSILIHSAEKAAQSAAAQASEFAAEPVAEPAATIAAVPAEKVTAVSSADVASLQQQMQQMLVLQQEMMSQLQANTQLTMQGVSLEVKTGLKITESWLKQQIDTSLKASAKKSEEIRSKAAAKERQELEKAIAAQLSQVAGSLQRDLVKAMADTAREQARAAVTATVNAVTPQLAATVTAALQRELGSGAGNAGLLQGALERALGASLVRPLHEALRENFASSIIPAFERATQVMFNQVETAFSSWLAESNQTVSTAQNDATSALTSAVSQLNSVVSSMRTDLVDTSRTLSRMASSAASRTTDAGSGGGALSVAELEAKAAGRPAAPVDPRVEIGTLLGVRRFEEALVKALNTASLDVLVWTCRQVDPAVVLGGNSVGVSQTTLLSLVHQLAADLHNDVNTALKMAWLNEAAPAIDPHDPVTAPHIKGVLSGVMGSLKQLVNSLPATDATAKKAKITLHLFNSLLHQ